MINILKIEFSILHFFLFLNIKRMNVEWLLIISIEDMETNIRLSLLRTEPNKLNMNTIHLPLSCLLHIKFNSGDQIIHRSLHIYLYYIIGGL